MSEGPTPSEMAKRPEQVARLLDRLRALNLAYSPGHHGRWSAARRAGLFDVCLRELFAEGDPPAGVAMVALGGHGRGELAPLSDIDLLILHPGDRPAEVAAVAEKILYPLWDAGFAVGHAVRTVPECTAVAVERLDAATAMLDGRVLTGDEAVWREAHASVLRLVRDEPWAFAGRLLADAHERHGRFGSVSHLIEPDVKEGAGGLRDVCSLGWLAAAVADPGGPEGLEAEGLLGAAERQALDAAQEFLVRVRSALHLATGRATDRLYLDQQAEIAHSLGFADEPGLRAVDGLMRALSEHARQVEHVVANAFNRFLEGGSQPEVVPSPEGVLRAFASLARERGVMSPATLDLIDAVELPAPVEWTEGVCEAFLEILRAGEEGVRALEAMDRIGVLERFLPEWAPIRCRPQRDPYHRYTVDMHLLQALGGMARLLGDAERDDPLAVEAAGLVSDGDALLLGALLHDIGKTGEGNHVPASARVAAEALDRMGLPEPTRELAAFMVAQHLLLPDTATRRDIGDEDLVLDVAAKVGVPERLAALYLLAVADAGATGPLAWTPWRAALVRELVTKVQRVLERGDMGTETAEQLAERVRTLRQLLATEEPGEVDRFLLRMPRSYVLTVPPDEIAAHVPLVRKPIGASEVRTISGQGSREGTFELTVVAADRPGLLSWIAGAFTLAGLSILSAKVFTTEDGVAVDVFEVEGLFERDVGEERWRDFRSTLRKAMEGRLRLAHGVAEKRKRYPAPRDEFPIEVAVHNDASDFFSVVEVGTTDRIGLLFEVTRTLQELRLDVRLAKVATYGSRVVDAFYVRDELGRKVEEAQRIDEIEGALRARLEGLSAAPGAPPALAPSAS
ncbi:MAG: ACT domain-containing protein [Actinomycetota bacterium]